MTREGTDWAAPIKERITLPIFFLSSWVIKILIAIPITVEKVRDAKKIKICISKADIIFPKLLK